jgi:hypothetical protein
MDVAVRKGGHLYKLWKAKALKLTPGELMLLSTFNGYLQLGNWINVIITLGIKLSQW